MPVGAPREPLPVDSEPLGSRAEEHEARSGFRTPFAELETLGASATVTVVNTVTSSTAVPVVQTASNPPCHGQRRTGPKEQAHESRLAIP
jgi:hypothetical protein